MTPPVYDEWLRSEHRVSLVVPMFNEEDNVGPMLAGVEAALTALPYPWELIVVNDCSTDRTEQRLLEEKARRGDHIRLLSLQRNFGQTAAMQAGIDAARGDIIVTLDGDLQNDPQDIPGMVARLIEQELDLLVGWRQDRHDNYWRRKIPSRLGNWLIGRVTGVRMHDFGCTLKVFRASVIRDVRLYGDMHRFIPAWIALHTSRERLAEHVVRHHPRRFGKSKYGMGRVQHVGLDLLSVYFFLRYRANPAQFFGRIGLTFSFLGFVSLAYMSWMKWVQGEAIANRPLFMVGILFIVMSVQFLTTGVLSELLSRTYYESSRIKPYVVRRMEPSPDAASPGWNDPAALQTLGSESGSSTA